MHRANRSRLVRNLEISSQDLRDVIFDELIPQQETGLWLDLRSTAIHPKAAIEQLEMETEASSFVDRIILSERMFQNLVDANDLYLTTSQILYQSSGSNDIYLSSSRGLSTPFGSVSSAPSDSAMPVEDPMQAIELVSGGKWLLLGKEEENTDDNIESLRVQSVGNFLDIVSTSSGMWNSSAGTSGLVLPTTLIQGENPQDQNEKSSNLGGVAVACDTKSALMQLASILQLRQGGTANLVTESGIILQNSGDSPPPVATAVALPFSIDLWQVAALVFGKESFNEDMDEYE